MIIRPQPGPQTMFMSTPADIAIYGGAAGGGKTRGLLMEYCRHTLTRPGFTGVCFRRNFVQIFVPGGLWDAASLFYPQMGASSIRGNAEWYWPRHNTRVRFAHLEHEDTVEKWMGSAVPLLGFDELTHFTERQFWYMLSRNRLDRPLGIKPYVRATCNPEPGSWVEKLLEWWIDQETGLPIPERSGVIRWFIRRGDDILWADQRDGFEKLARGEQPKSLTFIAARLEDNPALMEADPAYEANLMALPLYERSILLGGNWKVKRSRGMRFKREWFEIVDEAPPDVLRQVRYWDRAATEMAPGDKPRGNRSNDPDYTAGVKMMRSRGSGLYYVCDARRCRQSPGTLIETIRNTASQDGSPNDCELWMEEDPGSAGKHERFLYAKELEVYGPSWSRPTGSKWARSAPFSSAAEHGRVKIVRGPWNKAYLDELESFVDDSIVVTPPGYHDDQVDASSGAFNKLQHS